MCDRVLNACCLQQVRLMLVLAPVMCILSGIGVSQVLSTYMKNLDISRPDKKTKKQQDSTYPIKNEVSSYAWLRPRFKTEARPKLPRGKHYFKGLGVGDS